MGAPYLMARMSALMSVCWASSCCRSPLLRFGSARASRIASLRFLQERARALVALQITITVLFAPNVGTGGHVVGILRIAHVPDGGL